MYHHSCQPCSQPSQNAPANSLSDFFPAGYRVSSAHEKFPYYISVPVYLEEENNCGSCGGCVAALVRRMRSSAEFPHEVGLFLSYPPEDVKGFIENRAANAKCTGVWKVYGDERQARQTFAKYKKCTQVYCERWQSGSGLDKLAVADR